MKPHSLPCILALGFFFFLHSSNAAPTDDRIVVMISLDGLAHFYFDDPKAEMPTIRALAAEGARAEKMKAVMPTVTWPNHTSLVTGVSPAIHGVVGNTYLDRETGKVVPLIWDPTLDKEQIVKVPTIYDAAKAAGLKTAAVTWPGSRNAKNLDWTLPCVNSSELFLRYGTPTLWEEFKQAGIPYENEADGFKPGKGEERDANHVRMFNLILHNHRPQLALLHVLEVDHVEHAKGPQSAEAYAAVKFADGCVREVWDELKRDFPGKATLIIVSDHGFVPIRQTIQPNVLLRKEGVLKGEDANSPAGPVRAVSEGGALFLYVLDAANRQAILDRLVALFQDVEGIGLVIPPKDFAKYGLADPLQNPRMADLVLSAKPGYIFSGSVAGNLLVTPKTEEIRGSHGFDPNLPALHATFVAWGAGIKPGAKIGTIKNTDVAPTIAALLGIPLPGAEGRALEEILVH